MLEMMHGRVSSLETSIEFEVDASTIQSKDMRRGQQFITRRLPEDEIRMVNIKAQSPNSKNDYQVIVHAPPRDYPLITTKRAEITAWLSEHETDILGYILHEAKTKTDQHLLQRLYKQYPRKPKVSADGLVVEKDGKTVYKKGHRIVDAYNIDVKLESLRTCFGHTWMNNEVLIFMIEWWSDLIHMGVGWTLPRPLPTPLVDQQPLCFITDTMFYSAMYDCWTGEPWHQILRRTFKLQLFTANPKVDFIIIPVNLEEYHWSVIVVNVPQSTFMSLNRLHDKKVELQVLNGWWHQEYKRRNPGYEFKALTENTPNHAKQDDGYNCGVFTILYVMYTSLGLPPIFDTNQLDQVRLWIIQTIYDFGKSLNQVSLPEIPVSEKDLDPVPKCLKMDDTIKN